MIPINWAVKCSGFAALFFIAMEDKLKDNEYYITIEDMKFKVSPKDITLKGKTTINFASLYSEPLIENCEYNLFLEDKGWVRAVFKRNMFFDMQDKVIPYKKISGRINIKTYPDIKVVTKYLKPICDDAVSFTFKNHKK